MRFLPAQPRAALASSLSAADIHLVTLKPGCESAVFPSKLYGVAAVGRPVLFIGPRNSEIAQLVSARRMGLVFERTELDSLADALRQLASDRVARAELARNAGRFHNESRGLERALDFWETVGVAAAP